MRKFVFVACLAGGRSMALGATMPVRCLVFLLGTIWVSAWADDDPVTVRVSDIYYGIVQIKDAAETGTYISQPISCKPVGDKTDRIPVLADTTFGINIRINASKGHDLAILTKWKLPAAAIDKSKAPNASLGMLKNHSLLQTCIRLRPPDVILGEWTVEVYLVGIDEPLDTVKEAILQQRGGLLVYRRTFELNEPTSKE
jgi:hypothetical protein